MRISLNTKIKEPYDGYISQDPKPKLQMAENQITIKMLQPNYHFCSIYIKYNLCFLLQGSLFMTYKTINSQPNKPLNEFNYILNLRQTKLTANIINAILQLHK